jgi:hypothetical protein
MVEPLVGETYLNLLVVLIHQYNVTFHQGALGKESELKWRAFSQAMVTVAFA